MMCHNKDRRLVRMPSLTYLPQGGTGHPWRGLRSPHHGPEDGPNLRAYSAKAALVLRRVVMAAKAGCAVRGFTLIEILIVIVILAIAAMTAIPMMGSAASVQIRSAGNMIAADLEYAKSLAISKGQNLWVVFDEGAESYSIEGLDAVGNRITIPHPVKKGFDYIIDFQDEGLGRVEIADADFDGDFVRFDYLGSPDKGGTVHLQAGDMSATVSVEPVTGYITVGN